MAIIDATIIESSCRSKSKVLEEMPEDRKEDEFKSEFNSQLEYQTKFQETKSADPDAVWIKKGKKSHFGYKSFATVDKEGFISKTMTVPANESEVNKLEEMIIPCNQFLADKGYDSKKNRTILNFFIFY